jgi:predicted O-methyltransferase YrrM
MDKISIRNARYAKEGLKQLCEYISEDKRNFMVEIGSYVGDSSEIFAQYFKFIYCVDPWENGYDSNDAASYQYPMNIIESQFDELCGRYDNIKKIKKKSIDVVDEFKNKSLDMVYIDGKHTYEAVKEDIKLWLPKIKDNGYIAGHDYQSKFQGTIDAVKEVLGYPNLIFPDTSWIFKMEDIS